MSHFLNESAYDGMFLSQIDNGFKLTFDEVLPVTDFERVLLPFPTQKCCDTVVRQIGP